MRQNKKKKKICIYSLTGKFQNAWKCSSTPLGLTYYNNSLFVCEGSLRDPSHHIEVISVVTGKCVNKFGSKGDGKGQFNTPLDIVVKDDILYISDCENNRIQVWTVTGEYKTFWGVKGSKDGELNGLGGLALKGEQLLVVDIGNERVQVFE